MNGRRKCVFKAPIPSDEYTFLFSFLAVGFWRRESRTQDEAVCIYLLWNISRVLFGKGKKKKKKIPSRKKCRWLNFTGSVVRDMALCLHFFFSNFSFFFFLSQTMLPTVSKYAYRHTVSEKDNGRNGKTWAPAGRHRVLDQFISQSKKSPWKNRKTKNMTSTKTYKQNVVVCIASLFFYGFEGAR